MAKNNVIELAGRDTIVDPLTDLLKSGAERWSRLFGQLNPIL